MIKDYKAWMRVKSQINNTGNKPKSYSERQIWWCSIGENIGIESDGKGNKFLRPVLVIKKFGYEGFFGVPLTSRPKPNQPFYFHLNFRGKQSCILLSQARTFDAARLIRKMGELDKTIFHDIKIALSDNLSL